MIYTNHYIQFKVNYSAEKDQKNIVIDAPDKSPEKTPDGQEINLLE